MLNEGTFWNDGNVLYIAVVVHIVTLLNVIKLYTFVVYTFVHTLFHKI